MPSKRIIVLEREDSSTYRAAFWVDVPATRQRFYAKAVTWVSAWPDASQAELDALRAGQVAEVVDTINFNPALSSAAKQTALESRWAALQAEVTAKNPWSQYGRFWNGDGSGWTAGGVA